MVYLTINEKKYELVEILAEKADYYLDKGAGTIEKNDYKKTAFTICADGIKRFPNYKRIDLLKNIQKNITQNTYDFTYPLKCFN